MFVHKKKNNKKKNPVVCNPTHLLPGRVILRSGSKGTISPKIII